MGAPGFAAGVRWQRLIGFPFGYFCAGRQTRGSRAGDGMADELDVVINLIALRNGDWGYLESEMRAIVALVHGHAGSGREAKGMSGEWSEQGWKNTESDHRKAGSER